jgi:hypothetical protein
MTRTTARYTCPLTVTIRPDERALLDAYAAENSMTITELVRDALAYRLGRTDTRGEVAHVSVTELKRPPATAVRRLVRLQEQRGLALLEAKRDRQRG